MPGKTVTTEDSKGNTPEVPGGYGKPQPLGFHRFTGLLNTIGSLWIIVLMVLINGDIIGREFFQRPVRGVTELISLSIVGIVFLQLAHTLWVGRFTRADVLIGKLLKRGSPAGYLLLAFFHLVGAVLLAVIFYASYPLFWQALSIGEYVGAIGDFTAPTWPVRFVVLLGSASTSLTFLLLALSNIRQAFRRPK